MIGCQHAPDLQHGDYLFPQTVPSAPTTRKLETTSSSHLLFWIRVARS
uniref:Uncharacterized protein n=1 Tax=Brassica oleracea TaxID=3712 RepID=A0A3P6EVJ8_BRAOL|nr:unnamed protein product [Brassica oleracea]